MNIHPSAVVSPAARLADDVEIGPFAIIEPDVVLGAGCRLAAHVVVKQGTTLGCGTTVLEGAVLGGLPQHTHLPRRTGKLSIGQRNMIREQVTVNRALHEGNITKIGDDCLLMIGAHVAHDCQVGNKVILTNNVLLGGHVVVQDQACLGGAAAIHQFCRVGRLAMVAACAKAVQDIPPYMLTDGDTAMIVGLNRVGLRRAGFSREEITELKSAYRIIYRQGLSFREILVALHDAYPHGPAAELAAFFHQGKRGFVQERRRPPKAAIRLHRVDDAPAERLSNLMAG